MLNPSLRGGFFYFVIDYSLKFWYYLEKTFYEQN